MDRLDEFLRPEGRVLFDSTNKSSVVFGYDHAGREVAVRTCVDSGDVPAYTLMEHYVSKRVKHPCIVEALESKIVTNDSGSIVSYSLVTPKAKSDVYDFSSYDIPFETRLGWLRDAAEGMWAMHKLGLVHNDIKPENIFVYEDGARLGDLGMIFWQVSDRPVRRGGAYRQTYTCRAPEYTVSKYYPWHTPAADVWSWGATLWFIVYGDFFVPFNNDVPRRIYHWMKADMGRMIAERTKPDNMPQETWALVDRLFAGTLVWDPNERWTSDRLLAELGVAPREPVSRLIAPPVVSTIPTPIRNSLVSNYYKVASQRSRMPEYVLRLAAAFAMRPGETNFHACLGLAMCLASCPSFCDKLYEFPGYLHSEMLRILNQANMDVR